LKYKVLNKGYEFITEDELLDTLLKYRGVENPKKLLNINKLVLHDGMLLKNMDRGLNMLNWHIENNSNIHILFDVDNDGVTSGTVPYNYIKKINKNAIITYSMNEEKKHGIILENLKQYKFDLLIVPDAGTNNVTECKILHEEHDVDILILDHHNIEKENPYAIVINCQDGQYPNPTLSGAGVVYKFLKEYDKKYSYNFAEDDLDLVSLGIIGDQMDLRNYETRYIALEGLKKIKNNFIKEYIIKNKISDEDIINFGFVGWKIVPYINAVTRVGTDEERIRVIDAFLGKEEIIEYQPRRKSKNDPKPPIELQSLQKAMVRETTNIKARQDKLVKQGMEQLVEKIEADKLNLNKVIIVDGTDILEKSFTGLVANKLASIYKRPIIILKKMKEEKGKTIYGGSFRNYDLFPVESFFDVLQGLETFNKVGGHPNAGGFEIYQDNINKTQCKINELFKDISIEDVYLVDYEIPVGRLKEKHITQVGQWADIWGNTLKKPLFAITDISMKVEDIQLIGEKRNLIRFEKVIGNNKIVFIKKFASEEIYNRMIMKSSKGLSKKSSSRVKLDVIGEFIINKWNENEYPQIEIIDFNASKDKDFRF
jgi:single-stranded-DNA-specific exonuclease